MTLRDGMIMAGICFIWAVNAVLSRYVIAMAGIPPLFLSASRFMLAALVLLPFLRPMPAQIGSVLLVGLLMGAGHFGLLLSGYGLVDASLAAILLQVGIPLTALLSALLIGERVGRLRSTGIAIALCGVGIVLWRPGQATLGTGAILVLLSAMSLALGSVLLKRLKDITPLRMQAWTGLISILPLSLSSFLLETHQVESAARGATAFASLLVFSALVVTVVSHTAYYRLLRRYDASVVAPLTLMFPLMTVGLGMATLGERPGPAFFVGTAIALIGIAVVMIRPKAGGQPPA
ncbi:putative membrane protein [Rhizobium sp. PP-CC-2G-626]|nr:putative membrane protein [Rhizobium sp. PP-CC-2G-626]